MSAGTCSQQRAALLHVLTIASLDADDHEQDAFAFDNSWIFARLFKACSSGQAKVSPTSSDPTTPTAAPSDTTTTATTPTDAATTAATNAQLNALGQFFIAAAAARPPTVPTVPSVPTEVQAPDDASQALSTLAPTLWDITSACRIPSTPPTTAGRR